MHFIDIWYALIINLNINLINKIKGQILLEIILSQNNCEVLKETTFLREIIENSIKNRVIYFEEQIVCQKMNFVLILNESKAFKNYLEE